MPDSLHTDLVALVEDGMTRSVRFFRRIIKEESQTLDLTQPQYNALRELQFIGEQRMSDLATLLELTNGATTGLVERLEARGLVERASAPGDGRGVVVRITPEGRRCVEQVLGAVKLAMADALSALDTAQRHMAVGGIQALANMLEAPRGR